MAYDHVLFITRESARVVLTRPLRRTRLDGSVDRGEEVTVALRRGCQARSGIREVLRGGRSCGWLGDECAQPLHFDQAVLGARAYPGQQDKDAGEIRRLTADRQRVT